MTRSLLVRAAFAVLGLVPTAALVACGGAAPAAHGAEPPSEMAPAPPPPPPEPTSVEEAQRQIAQAASEISGRSLHVVSPADADASKPRTEAPKTEPSGNAAPSKASEYQHDELTNTCMSPCRALASMKRAVDALCRMTGETDTKCLDARKTLSDNVGRTASCKCGS